jgi:hypothetical protein
VTKPAWLDVPVDIDQIATTMRREGIVGCPGAFTRKWVQDLREDVETAFAEARSREGGAVSRGPQRWYVEIHPEALRGFSDLAGHPWVRAVCETVLGPDYTIVELGFDIPFPGARDQPWHRDFPSPPETREAGRLTSLAFNLTCVDTVEEMGPFEVAPGTHWEPGLDFEHQMFPDRDQYPRLQEAAVRKYPQMGDISARSALTLHRGTANISQQSRPVVVLGVDAPGAGNAEKHDLAVTASYRETLPAYVRDHLDCPVVDRLTPITQKHTIEGLVMG